MATKAGLKAIKASIDSNNFTAAAEKAASLVREDPKNYTGLLFLGFAREKLDQNDEAEKSYQEAVNLKPTEPQALKGLITLYEKQSSTKIDQYHNAATQLAQIYADQDDRAQCQIVIDKYLIFAKRHGSRAQYRHALELMLPSSPLYSTLEGRVPHPSHTYSRLLESAEAEEKDWVNNQIGERRTRLGAKIDHVTQQVKCEAIERFRAEDILAELINWTKNDDERHELEERQLRRAYENLLAAPQTEKPAQRDKVLNLANGMVIIKHPFALAWKLALDWVNADSLQDWDAGIFRAFIEYFPDEGLSKILRGFLAGDVPSTPEAGTPQNEASDLDDIERLSEADRLILMSEGIEECGDSLLGTRIMAETYLSLEEYQSAADMARKAQKLHVDAIRKFAIDLQDSIDAVNITLAKSLISYQSPRHHPESKDLFNAILERKPLLTVALLGIGLILEEDEDYVNAVTFLERAAQRDHDNIRIRLELAWCHALAGSLETGLAELEDLHGIVQDDKPPNLTMKSELLYRIAYCKWHINSSVSARKNKEGPYKDLIASIKANPNYAPTYTLLGIYFQDYGKSKQRARVALQKAFELSTSELAAAQRLAKIFANAAEWDLVELVAQRVADSGKARPAPGSKKKAFSWPYAALGVVQMNKQQYPQSIVSFQSALRISPEDYHSWVGLGESYHNSGRYIAATRTFLKAESLDHGLPGEQTWFAKYMLANVQREMGAFDEAILGYENVLKIVQDEFGVLVALLQTLAESARAKAELGMFGQAADLAKRALEAAKKIAGIRVDIFNLWKAVADAFSVLASTKAQSSEIDFVHQTTVLSIQLQSDEFATLSTVDKVARDLCQSHGEQGSPSIADSYLLASILACKRAVYASASDTHAQAISWYNLGWAEYQAYFSETLIVTTGRKPQRGFLKASMKCFKRAIELEAGNSDFWNALGVVTMTMSPTISQHSFVRSLHLNEHSARTWTNLGVLYLINNALELANEAFTRAQSADPEYSHAWIGQGLLATLYGNLKEARGLFTHAFEISSASSIPAKRQYALSSFDHLLNDIPKANDPVSLLQPSFALRQLASQTPSDQPFIHLLGLFTERADNSEEAAERLTSLLSTFGSPTSDEGIVRYHQANADLARSLLAKGSCDEALAHARNALDRSSASMLGPRYSKVCQKWRLSAHITAGLAQYRLKNYNDSLTMFEAARGESNDAPDVVCMLAQVLWAKDTEGERDRARETLFECVEKHPEHVQAVNLLAVIGLLDGDDDILEAVEEDLKSLRISDKVVVTDKLKIANVLGSVIACKKAAGGEEEEDLSAIADATKSVMLKPNEPQGWIELANATSDPFSAEMALKNAMRQIPPGGTLAAEDYAIALANTGRRQDAFQAILVAPWKAEGYLALKNSV